MRGRVPRWRQTKTGARIRETASPKGARYRNPDQAGFSAAPYAGLRVSITAKALWYIESHLSENLSLETVAEAIGISRFHLSRAFPVSAGYAFGQYIRARRLSEAAKVLAGGAPDILDVALDAGYGSHEAFTRAFSLQFGVTPEQIRAQATVERINVMEPIRMETATTTPLAPPQTIQWRALLIFGIGQRYQCNEKGAIPSQWLRFVPHLGNIPGQVGRIAYGVIYNTDDTGGFDYLCGVEVKEFPAQPAEFTRLRVPPQKYAVFEHKDHISTIASTFSAIWNHGLTDSGFRAADGPALERYGEEFDGRTGLGGLQIWVPIR